ncbi:MAG: hypothetical protein ACK4K0_02910 [Flavobacteriales bacterium]
MRLLLVIGFLILASDVVSQNVSADQCRQMHKGRYIMESPGGGNIYIKRKRKKQHEYYLKTGNKYVFSIVWTEDCIYELIFLRGNSKHDRQFKGNKLKTEIVHFSYDTYECVLTDKEGNQFTVLITKR